MKIKFISKIFFLCLCLFVYNSAIFAQENSNAVKVAEYDDKTEKIETFVEKANLFLDKLSKSVETTQGFIVINVKDDLMKKNLSERLHIILSEKSQLKNRNIIAPIPGQRYSFLPEKSEFWIVPQTADYPYTPNCALCVCPTINIDGVKVAGKKTVDLTFTANISGGSADTVTYKWSISAGKIIEGQETPVIKVDAEGAKEIIATVEIGGVCEECLREASLTTKIQ